MSKQAYLLARCEAVLKEIEHNRVTHWVHQEAIALVRDFHEMFSAPSPKVNPDVQADKQSKK